MSATFGSALRGIKAVGGITIAQDPISAKQPDMPISVIGTGFIDFILTPEKIGQTIIAISQDKRAFQRNHGGFGPDRQHRVR
jgi:chemotaxis response regulator CheB